MRAPISEDQSRVITEGLLSVQHERVEGELRGQLAWRTGVPDEAPRRPGRSHTEQLRVLNQKGRPLLLLGLL